MPHQRTQPNTLTEPLAQRPPAGYGAAASSAADDSDAALAGDAGPQPSAKAGLPSRHLTLDELFTVKHGVAKGDAGSVGEQHLSYLCRAWEVNHLKPIYADDSKSTLVGGRVETFDTPYRRPVTLLGRSSPTLLFVFQASLTVAAFYFSTSALGIKAASAAPLSLFVSHLLTWLVVLVLSGGVMYRSYSLVDGMNTITRFTVKLSIAPHDQAVSFVQSSMASSISSSVSTRGSTLNKLMIGTSFSLGLGLFLKFMTLPDADRSWLTDVAASSATC